MNNPSTAELKRAFESTAIAGEYCREITKVLADIHYKSEAVDNNRFLVENAHKWVEPSSDAQDELFARQVASEEALTGLYKSGSLADALQKLNTAQMDIQVAIKALSPAPAVSHIIE